MSEDHAGCPCGNYEASEADCTECKPIDWAARFRAAAEVAEREGAGRLATLLRNTGGYLALYRPAVVEAIGRALLGEESEDPFGVTCLDCGEPIDDERPYGANRDGELIHVGCGDPMADEDEDDAR